MITFTEFQKRLIRTETKRGAYYQAPLGHVMSLYGELFGAVCDADHDTNFVEVAKVAQFIPKNDKRDWKLYKLVEV